MIAEFAVFSLLTSLKDKSYLAITSPPWVSIPGRKAAPLCAAFAFSAPYEFLRKGGL